MDRLGDMELRALRVFLESVVCDLCRFRQAADDGVPPGQTRIHQEVRLGPGAYADTSRAVRAGDRSAGACSPPASASRSGTIGSS